MLEAVKKFLEVKSAYLVFGKHDVIAFAEAPTYEALSALTTNVNATLGVKSTETIIEAAE